MYAHSFPLFRNVTAFLCFRNRSNLVRNFLFSLEQHEGSFSFREAWVHHADDGGSPLKHAYERLPPPIVVDLNGDGQSEVLVATHDARLQVRTDPNQCSESGRMLGPECETGFGCDLCLET